MSARRLLVTGASGQLAGSALAALLGGAHPVVAGTRHPRALAGIDVEVRRLDFDDARSLERAFEGVDRVLLVGSDAEDRPGGRALQHARAVRAAEAAGVSHVVYPSRIPAGPVTADDLATEAALGASRMGFTILRSNLFADLIAGSLRPSGLLVTARGDGAVAYVARGDVARAAAAALVSGFDGRRTLRLTGPEAVDGDALAALLSAWSGEACQHVAVTPTDYARALSAGGAPASVVDALVGLELAAGRGELAAVTDDVAGLTGVAPTSVAEVLSRSGCERPRRARASRPPSSLPRRSGAGGW